MTVQLLTQLARQATKKSFPKGAQESKKLSQRFITSKKAEELTIQPGKKNWTRSFKKMSSAVRKKAAEYKDNNAVTKTLYNELFTKSDILEDALRQMGGIENRR